MGGVKVTRRRRRRGSGVIDTAADFVISERTDFAYKIDLTAEVGSVGVDTTAMSMDPTFLILLWCEQRSITR